MIRDLITRLSIIGGLSLRLGITLAAVGGGLSMTPATADEPSPLTVMSWNLEWFYDDEPEDNHSKLAKEKTAPSRTEWNWRRDAVAASVAEVRPTVMAVQEVENRRVLWYLSRSLERNHSIKYRELGIEGRDHYTEQDVGMLFRKPADVLLTTQFALSDRMRPSGQFYDVPKHLLATFEYPVGDGVQRVTVMNVHLRSGAEGESVRKRQARLVHRWLAPAIRSGENVILLGDFNTELKGADHPSDSDLAIISGRETTDPEDDLIDLHSHLPQGNRQTHLLPGRQFDRILCSPGLFRDEPGKVDLAFKQIEVRRDLVVRGGVDSQQDHWDRYWKMPAEDRDLSDHYPILATFETR